MSFNSERCSKNFFIIKIFSNIVPDLRNTSGKKIPFVSVDFTCFVLFFRETTNLNVLGKRSFSVVASRQVETPFWRSIGRQRGRVFGFTCKRYWGNRISNFLWICGPISEPCGCWLFGSCCARNFSGRRKFETASKNVGRQTLGKHLCSGSKKRKKATSRKELVYGRQASRVNRKISAK